MDYYYDHSSGMSSRGRYSSRGGSSYRGGRGDSYRGSRGYSTSRGSYSSSRGRGGSYYPKYDSSGAKYSSDSKYSSHQRYDDSPYRKSETSYITSRDHSHRSDMEMPRKRMRSDSYSQGQGSSSRRSHESEDYRASARYAPSSSYSDSRSYGDSRTIFKKPRVDDYKPKDDFRSSRKDMTRPSLGVSRIRTYRGRPPRGRGMATRGEGFILRKRIGMSPRLSSTELLALRRLKMQKLRRMRQTRMGRMLDDDDDDDDDKKEGSKSDDDDPVGEKPEGDEDDDDDDKNNLEGDGERVLKKEKKEDGELEDEGENKEVKVKVKKEEIRTDFFGKPFIKLQCPQCSTKVITFKEYTQHLYQPIHVKAMRDKSILLKTTLAKMRIAQRAKQKKADEEDLTSLTTRTMFCPICKLNYSQDKSEHQTSEAHRKMKNFLLPYCRVCHVSFKSPMLYEGHICSLDHLRRKNAVDERMERRNMSPGCLDNFMVLDSVGSGDEAEELKEDEALKSDADKKDEDDLNLGAEYIRKVEVLYCELCRLYLPRLSDQKKVLRIHCCAKNHLRCYLRFSSDELLDRIRDKGEVKKEEGEKKEAKEDAKEEAIDTKKAKEESIDDEGGIDEKMWADVGDLLSQVEPETKSDDEEEEGRFDRFKSNEKKENGEVVQEDAVAEVADPAATPKEEVAKDAPVKVDG